MIKEDSKHINKPHGPCLSSTSSDLRGRSVEAKATSAGTTWRSLRLMRKEIFIDGLKGL